MLIKNGTILLDDKTVFKGHIIIENNKIKEILQELPWESSQFGDIIDAADKIVAPGLINGHTHSYANFFKTAADGLPLETMMFYITEEGASLNPENVYYNTMLGALEMIRSGITSCLDQLSQSEEGLNSAMQAYSDIGMRATVAPMFSDKNYYQTLPINTDFYNKNDIEYNGKTTEQLIDINLRLLKKWHKKYERLNVGFGPSGPQRCSKEMLQKSMNLAIENDTVVHTHTLETHTQKITSALFFGKNMISYLHDIGCLNERLTMAHGVWITEEEAKIVADSGANIAHCPACNLYLGSGIAPVNIFRKYHINIGLGTDGPNGGCNQNMLETMKLAALLHRRNELDADKWPLYDEIFNMATKNNAKVLGEKDRLGKIEKGQLADIVIYNPANSLELQPMQNPKMQLVFGETGRAVESVIINGKLILDHGKFTQIDEQSILKHITKQAKLVNKKLDTKRNEINQKINKLNSILPRDF